MSTLKLNASEQKEWDYIYDERLGLLGAGDIPTDEEDRIATSEADKAIRALRGEPELEQKELL